MLDTLDIAVVTLLALAVAFYFGKDFVFSPSESAFAKVSELNSRDIGATLKASQKNTVIFYASQTGTAEDYAHKLAKELTSKFGLKVLLADIADYDFDNLQDLDPQYLLGFVVATYGEGEPTDNSVDFFSWLEDEAEELPNLKYIAFGLGNSTYEFYNAMGQKLNEKLESLGAQRLAPYGQGDDGLGTMDEDFLSWKEACFDALKTNLSLEEHELVYVPSFELSEDPALSASDEGVSNGEPNKAYVEGTRDLTKGPFDHTHPYLAKITRTQELFNSSERSCVHAEFDISGSNLRYSTGDHLAVWPSNSNENVETFLKCFGLTEKAALVFNLKALDSTVHIPFPTPITFEAVVRHHLEISGPISRQTLMSIAPFAPTESAKARCLKLGGDKKVFAEEIHSQSYNLADALLSISEGALWSDVPFVFLVELIAHLQPRYYSISSSSLNEKTSIHITAVVEAEEKDGRAVTGVVTNLLKDIEVHQNKTVAKTYASYDLDGPNGKFSNYKLPVHVRRSTFKLPSNPATPIILVGPGTGLAPMRGFIREKVKMIQNSENTPVGKILLFYGCRNRKEDFLYKNEWPEYSKVLGENFELDTAFSREEPSQKVYVQHKIKARSKEINELLEKGAFIYVCGDASRMARDVQNTFVEILIKERGITSDRAAELIRSFKVQNRYQEDVW